MIASATNTRAIFHNDMCRLPTTPSLAAIPSMDSAYSSPQPTKTLHAAARDGDVRTLLTLVKQGAPIDERATSVKWTALHAAAALNNAVAVSVLLRHGADPNTYDVDGDTPLITAASLGHTEVVQQLVAKANVMQTSARGETALHVAAEAGLDDIASLLIARGGIKLVNARTKQGKTAYELAKGHAEIVEMICALKEAKETVL